jgi:hypothetical protein
MPLSIIGSGFGRTGTMSLKLALEQLGFGPCHHMEEVMGHPETVPQWCAAARGEPLDWEEVYRGYGSTVDWPGAHYWLELLERYPDARVIHTVRPAEAWWTSFSETIGTILADAAGQDDGPQSLTEMAHAIVAATFGSTLDDKAAALRAFEQRTADVRAAVAPDRLLVFEVRDGWGPLCEFLGVPAPDSPFPRTNDTAAFWETFGDAK